MGSSDLDGESKRPSITVAICTWNRAGSLARTLDSLIEMTKPDGLDWEVVVVNNNSTDSTDECILSYRGKLPIVRVFERQPGLSMARNAAVGAAKGDYIVWTDDDVIVKERWISAYHDAFVRHPDVAVFGGPILAEFEGEMPSWLEGNWMSVRSAYCHHDLGDRPIELSRSDAALTPYGANYALRSIEQRTTPYDPKLGASPTGSYVGEETTVMRTILRGGAKGLWVPDACVRHMNDQGRMNLKYLKKYYERVGRTEVVQGPPLQGRRLFGSPLWLWHQLVRRKARYFWSRGFKTPSSWLEELRDCAVTVGYVKEARRKPDLRPADSRDVGTPA